LSELSVKVSSSEYLLLAAASCRGSSENCNDI